MIAEAAGASADEALPPLTGLHRIARDQSIFDALSTLAAVMDATDPAEAEGCRALAACLAADDGALGQAYRACDFILEDGRRLPVPKAIAPLVLLGAVPPRAVETMVNKGQFDLAQMEYMRDPATRAELARRTDTLIASFGSARIETWRHSDEPAENVQRSEILATLRRTLRANGKAHTEEADRPAPARPSRTSRAEPGNRTSRKSVTPDQDARDTKAADKSGSARGKVTGLVTVAAVLAAGGLYLGLDGRTASGWTTEVAREVARLRGVPYAPPIHIDLPPLESSEFGDASLADADQQEAFLTWLGEGGSR
ncbi:hypothetical protein E0K89_000615 [Aquicoccus sp. SCR17]|nr:hypothetical protein [Carideicomes alvinocaridis]